MKNRMWILLVAMCISLAGFTGAYADDYSKGMMHGTSSMQKAQKMDLEDKFHQKAMFIMANAADLQLSEAQIAKIKALKIKVEKSLLIKDAEIEGVGLDVMEAMGKDEVDTNAVNGLIDKKYELKKTRAKEVVAACADIRQILTTEQYKKLKEKLMAKMTEKMKEMADDGCQMNSKQSSRGGMRMDKQ